MKPEGWAGKQPDSEFRFESFQPREQVRPLALSTSVTGGVTLWTPGMPSKGLADFRQAIFSRDFNTCQFCGFRSGKYQEFLAQNGVDRSARAVFTACIFCAQCVTLESVLSTRSGVLIRLPEMSQVALHQLMRVVYVLRIRQGTPADKARRMLDLLLERRQGAVEQLTSDEPSFLAEQMNACSTGEELCELRGKLRDIRLLPLDRRIIKEAELEFNQFPQILAYWRSKSGPLPIEREEQHFALLESVLGRWG